MQLTLLVALFYWLAECLPPDFAGKGGLPGIEEESAFRLKETIFTALFTFWGPRVGHFSTFLVDTALFLYFREIAIFHVLSGCNCGPCGFYME